MSIGKLETGIALYTGLFQVTNNTQIFHLFVFILLGIILQLSGFYPRKV